MLKVLSRLSKRERFIAYFFIVLLSLLLFERVVLSPINTKLEVLATKVETQEKKLLRSLHLLRQKDSIIEEYKKIAEQTKRELSGEEAITVLQSSIEEFAKKTGLNIVNMKPLEIDATKFDKIYAVEVSAEASILRLADFIYQAERDPKLIRVAEFSLSPKKGDTSILKADMLVTMIRLE